MCGIFCTTNTTDSAITAKEIGLLSNRGPNHSLVHEFENVTLGGFVLWQQGDDIVRQPVDCGNVILLFNGDVFDDVPDKSPHMGDSRWLCQQLDACADDAAICKLLSTVRGPYSLIVLMKNSRDLYFARDSLGRNSLLLEKTEQSLRLLSTSYWCAESAKVSRELPPVGLFKINLNNLTACEIYPWCSKNTHWDAEIENLGSLMGMEFHMRESIKPPWLEIHNSAESRYDLYELCREITEDSDDAIVQRLLAQPSLANAIQQFGALLERSVRDRVQTTPRYCKNCIEHRLADCEHAKIAILFSGGVDCTVLAMLVDKFACAEDAVDLINVSFEKENATCTDWQVPDRLSSCESLAELKRLCPQRAWNFVEVNVTRVELHACLQQHIKHLIYPLNTILDESLGCAFWFASRGQGVCDQIAYNSPARVVIVGSGADELFGGYMRHRNAYRRCNGDDTAKQQAVLDELEKDWLRIPTRNLARDDRVIGDNGKTSRAPFLEEAVVQYVRSLRANQRCCYQLREGLGDKLFLRLYAYQLGLRGAMVLKKRAIQFGSKIAIKSQNATDISNYLKC